MSKGIIWGSDVGFSTPDQKMDILVQCSATGIQLSNKPINKECYFNLDVFQLMVDMVARHRQAHFSGQVYTSVLLVYL